MKLCAIEKSYKPFPPICKRPALWGEVESELYKGNTYTTPLIYFQKPKWLHEDSFKDILKALSVALPKGFEIRGAE